MAEQSKKLFPNDEFIFKDTSKGLMGFYSDQEVDQFMYLAGSVGAIIDGNDPEIIEQDVAEYLDVPDISEDDSQLYSHLQEHEREMRMAIDEYNRKQHEPEVHHLEEVSDDEGF